MPKNQWRPKRDAGREARIEEHVVQRAREQKLPVDSLWWQYVKTATFPFTATYTPLYGTEPFCGSSKVQVIGLASQDACASELIGKVIDGHHSVLVPLRLLQPHGDIGDSVTPVHDWLYWVGRGEAFE